MTDWRKRIARMSLSTRVAATVGALLLAGGVLVSLVAFGYGRQAAREAYDRLLVGAAHDIAESISIINGVPVVDLPISAFELLALAPDDRIAYRVVGTRGETLTGYDDLPLPPARSGSDVALYDDSFFGAPARFTAVTRRFAERNLSGSVVIIVGHTMEAREALAYDITRNALVVLGLAGAAMMGLGLVAVRSALRPLDRISRTLGARDPYDLTPVTIDGPAEAKVMIDALNQFMGRLDRQVSTMRNLISDTAHQLRTPVAALRAQADLATEEPDPTRRAAIVAHIHRRSVGLGRLLDQMLSRALVIHRADNVAREPVDLRDVALEIVEDDDYRLISPDSDVRLVIGEDPVFARADALSLREAARNLLHNACKHGKGPVQVGASRMEGMSVLWVRDEGPGPPEDLLGRKAGRFALTAASRGDSSGLGLAIARSVAEAFDGTLEFSREYGGGFRVAIVLPATSQGPVS